MTNPNKRDDVLHKETIPEAPRLAHWMHVDVPIRHEAIRALPKEIQADMNRILGRVGIMFMVIDENVIRAALTWPDKLVEMYAARLRDIGVEQERLSSRLRDLRRLIAALAAEVEE